MRWSTILHKANIVITDIDHDRYDQKRFALVRSPREYDGRWLLRVLAYCVQSFEKASFLELRGVEKTPSLVLEDWSAVITHWYEFQLCSVKEIRQIAGRSQKVFVWFVDSEEENRVWQKVHKDYRKLDKVEVVRFSATSLSDLRRLSSKNCSWVMSIENDEFWITVDGTIIKMRFEILKPHKKL